MVRTTTVRKRAGETDAPGATAPHACDTGVLSRTTMTSRPPSPPQSAHGAHSASPPGRTGAGAAARAARAAEALDPRAPAPVPAPGNAPQAASAPVQAGQAAQPVPAAPAVAPEPPEPPHLHEPLGPDDPLAPLPFNPYKGNRGITRAWKALKYSIKGFRAAIREESAFRQELTLAAILVPIGVFIPVEPVERVLLLGSIMLVLIVELLNSSIENAVDRIGLERNELSGRAKDLGSAAVTVALLLCVMTWGLILVPRFGPPLLRWLGAL
ncbi:diacylglycerol kinase (ATP) [Paraburkholderia unamae]|uniref:Diacylglycerol kinase n=1 Tax=Paraburkholderia unamae TaxID=219649 RepID=A0ABX5KF11_9BURK|nr:diacylglycerol kinase (ATP) [Paraburkholderia unamae]RAR56871.1 diacylglycerol kinase (ATP) [Paraburkholderia unamae]